MIRTLRLDDEKQRVLGHALELYVRVGLGQFGEIARRLDSIHGSRLSAEQRAEVARLCDEIELVMWGEQKPWRIEEPETSLFTLLAFLIEGEVLGNQSQVRWAQRRCDQRRSHEQVEKRET